MALLSVVVAMAAMSPMAVQAQVHISNDVPANTILNGLQIGTGNNVTTHLVQPFTTPGGSTFPIENVVLHFTTSIATNKVKLYLYRGTPNPNVGEQSVAPTIPNAGSVDIAGGTHALPANDPGRIFEFGTPTSLGSGRYRFAAPAGTTLAANTTYHLYLWVTPDFLGTNWKVARGGNTYQCSSGWALLAGLSDTVNQAGEGWVAYPGGNRPFVTEIIGRPQRLPSPGPTITGTQTIGETLTADTSTIRDANGVPDEASSFTYQWYRVDADGTSSSEAISGATSQTYTSTEDDQGKRLRVQVTYTDDDCYEQATAAITSKAFNTFATGLAMSGTAEVGQTLTADLSGISDPDGLTGATYSYQWTRVDADGTSNPVVISGATSQTYTLVEADQGKRVRVTVSFIDGGGNPEALDALSETVSGMPVPLFDADASTSGIQTIYRRTTQVDLAEYLADGVNAGDVTFSVSCDSTYGDYYSSGTVSGATLSLVSNRLGHTHGNDTDGETSCDVTATTADATQTRAFSFAIPVSSRLNNVPEVRVVGRYENALEVEVTDPLRRGPDHLLLGWRTTPSGAWERRILTGAGLRSGSVPTIRIPGLAANTEYEIRAQVLRHEAFDHYANGRTIQERVLTELATGLDAKWLRNMIDGGASRPGDATAGTTSGEPIFLRAAVNGNVLTVTMNEALDEARVPVASAFTVPGRTVSGVTVSGSSVILTLGSSVGADETVTVSYAGTTLQDPEGTAAASFTRRAVANETPTVTLALTPATIDEDGGVSTVTATLDKPSPQATTVTVSATPVAPAVAGDYTLSGSRLTIAANSLTSTGSVTIAANDNNVHEGDKTVTVSATVTNSQGVTGPRDVTMTIADDDNAAPTGTVTIDDTTPVVGERLTADTSGIDDPDGLTNRSFIYLWLRVSGGTETEIAEATAASYTVVDADVGATLKVEVSFTDDDNNFETVESAETATVEAAPRPMVAVARVASPVEEGAGAQFTVTRTVVMEGALTVHYRVSEIGEMVASGEEGAKSVAFGDGDTVQTVTVPTQEDTVHEADSTVTVTLTADDAYNIGTATAKVTVEDDDNADPTGAVTIDDPTPVVGQTLTAVTSGIGDPDGLTSPTFTYQWIRVSGGSGTNLSGATAKTYTVVNADLGATLKVRVGFTDDDDTAETVESAETAAVEAAPLPTVSVAPGTTPVTEGTAATFTVTRSGVTTGALTVRYQVSETGGDRVAAADEGEKTIDFSGNETSVTVTVTVESDDSTEEADSVVTVSLTPDAAYDLGTDATAEVTVEDNDVPIEQPESLTLNIPAQAVRYVAGDTVDLTLPAANGGTGPYTYTLSPLPAGLSFDGSTRTLSGTPTRPGLTLVTYGVRDAADPPATAERTFNLRIKKSKQPRLTLNIPAKVMRYGAGDTVDLTLPAANGGTGPYAYTLAPLPAGLSFDESTRTLSGTPTTLGLTRLTYGARDAADPPATVTRTFNIRIKPGQSESLTLNTPAKLSYEVGDTVDLTLPAAVGGTGPYAYTLTPLPAGLSFDGSTRVLSGTPTTPTPGFIQLTYGARDTAGPPVTVRHTFRVRIKPGRSQSLTVTTPAKLSYEVGDTVDLTLPAAIGGTGPYAYTLAPLPAGLSFDGSTRVLSGTPTTPTPGFIQLTYGASDAANPPATVTRTFKIRIDGSTVPVVTIAAESGPVTEGEPAVFVLMRTGDASAPLTVTVDVSEAGSVLAGVAPTTVTFGENEAEARLPVATEDDSAAEADGRVTTTVSAGDGYEVAAGAGSAGVDVLDNDGPMAPRGTATPWSTTMTVADARVNESAGTPLAFRVSLAEASPSAVSVRYATSDGSATAGADYVAASGVVRFEPGETAKTVNVAVLEDAHDEGEETMTLTLSSPFGATISDGVATGTIVNTDAMPQAWLARFGRTVAGQVLDAVEGRMTAARRPGAEVSVAGRRIAAAGALDEAAFRDSGAAGEIDPEGLLTVSDRELLTGTSFALTEGTAESGFVSLWGRGVVTGFGGRDGELSVDGETRTGLLGADWARDDWAAGLIVGHSRGEGDYSGQGAGTVESSLTGVYPWGRRALSERVTVWGVAGYGEGTLTLEPEGQSRLEADMDLTMAAAGLRGVLLEAPAEGGLELAAKTDGLFVRSESEAAQGDDGGMLEAASAEVTRLRLGLEGTRAFGSEGGGTLTPSFELGVRHDGGDAETGFGVEVGAGLAWADPSSGVTADLRGRGLLAHEASGFREVGLSGSFAFDPSPSTDRGLSLSLSQTLGASATGGVDALYGRETMAGLAPDDDAGSADLLGHRRLEARVGYGLPAPLPAFFMRGHGFLGGMLRGRFTGTPELGFGLSEGSRDYSLGWRLTPEGGNAGSFELRLEATRHEAANGDAPEHGVSLRVTMRW